MITEQLQIGPVLSFSVPRADLAEFGALPDDVRADVATKLRLLERIWRSKGSVQGQCSDLAARLQRRGFSAKRLVTLYYEFTKSGDWRVLVNKAKAPECADRMTGLPGEFRTFAHDFLIRNQRGKARERYRALLDRLMMWRRTASSKYSIPGYDAPPADAPGCDHPEGWSYSRLMRLVKPTPFEQTAFSIGRGAAAAFRPQVYTTRVGLKPGQIFFFDDQVHDVRVNFVGNKRKIQRPLELVCMDCFSAAFVAHGFKPTVWNDATESRVMLRQEDMVWFAMHWLLNVGWREDTGTQVIAEHGTAAFPDWLRDRITGLTQGKISFTAGGVDRRAAFPGMFEGPARGNFRIKAGLESSFNLVRNETADLTQFPGQVGRNRDAAPEEWEARTRQNEALLLAAQALPKELADQLRFPFLEWNQFVSLALSIYDVIDRRTWHELEGWQSAGLLANEWRLAADAPWLPMAALLALDDGRRAVAEGVLAGDPVTLSRVRKLSPREVWQRGCNDLTRAPGYWLALLLPPEAPYAFERTVGKDHLFEFEDSEISPEPLRFLAQPEGASGVSPEVWETGTAGRMPAAPYLRPGEKFMAYLNPWCPSELHLCDARGRFIGSCPAWRTESKADLEAIHRRMGAAMKIEKELLGPVARAGAELSRQRAADAEFNARLLENAPVTRAGETKQRQANALEDLADEALGNNKIKTEEL